MVSNLEKSLQEITRFIMEILPSLPVNLISRLQFIQNFARIHHLTRFDSSHMPCVEDFILASSSNEFVLIL